MKTQPGEKPFIVANVRQLWAQMYKGEISFSRMVEMMNDISEEYHNHSGVSTREEMDADDDEDLNTATVPEGENSKALRYNSGKLKWSLVHFKSIEPMVRVLEAGAKKYAPDNWKKSMDKKEILECAQRHLASLIDGEEFDSETGESHAGHIMCNCMFYIFHSNKKQ